MSSFQFISILTLFVKKSDLFSVSMVCFVQREEDERARLYEEFVQSFQGDNTPGSKTFVRGGLINPNDKLKTDSEGQCD